MFSALDDLCARVERYAAGFDAALITLDDAVRVVDAAGRIERMAATLKASAAAKVAATDRWRGEGKRSAADWLAARTGVSTGAARETITMGERLEELPATAAAARAGRLSPAQASAIADAATADPAAEDALLQAAQRDSLGELRERCQKTKAAADPTPEATHQRIHNERDAHSFTDAEGAFHLRLRTTPEVGGRIRAVWDAATDRMFKAARDDDQREAYSAYAADALVALILGDDAADIGAKPKPAVSNPRFLSILRLDIEALARGWVEDDECCDIAGVGPVPVSLARDLLGESILKLVITKGVDVLNVTHLGRGANAAQKVALLWSAPRCTAEGCGLRERLENDHRDPFRQVRCTATTNLDPMCHHHHDLKTRFGWELVDGVGKRPMVPPDDPRHPRHKQSAAG